MPLAGPERSALLVIDIQERFAPHIHEYERVLARSARMIHAAQELGVPIVVTEQYPRGLGATVLEIRSALPEYCTPIEKTSFSCFGAPAFAERLEATAIDTLFLVGIECHVCVLQTAIEALDRGLAVHVLRDAVGARHIENADAGFDRMARAGAVLSTTEMAIFELLRDSGHPAFRSAQALVK